MEGSALAQGCSQKSHSDHCTAGGGRMGNSIDSLCFLSAWHRQLNICARDPGTRELDDLLCFGSRCSRVRWQEGPGPGEWAENTDSLPLFLSRRGCAGNLKVEKTTGKGRAVGSFE